MTQKLVLSGILAMALMFNLGACTNMTKTQQGAVSGAVLGVLTGGAVSIIAGGSGTVGALIGGAAGALAGGIIGHQQSQ